MFRRYRRNRQKSATVRHSFAELRARMVNQQIAARGITDSRILEAMRDVAREQFVPNELEHAACEDRALPLTHGQTISQPYTVAFMCDAARLTGCERVLEIGTGSGYGAAVLGRLARDVFTVERIPELAESAKSTLQRLGCSNVHVRVTNGAVGIPGESFDAMVVTAAANRLPSELLEQLADGGRLIIPIGEQAIGQTMWRFTRRNEQIEEESLGQFSFVPLISAAQSGQ
ncbi:MAG: protein-L-isoaspartate(D-aspartate) O-methyltransferase [Pirellulales bacterium]